MPHPLYGVHPLQGTVPPLHGSVPQLHGPVPSLHGSVPQLHGSMQPLYVPPLHVPPLHGLIPRLESTPLILSGALSRGASQATIERHTLPHKYQATPHPDRCTICLSDFVEDEHVR